MQFDTYYLHDRSLFLRFNKKKETESCATDPGGFLDATLYDINITKNKGLPVNAVL